MRINEYAATSGVGLKLSGIVNLQAFFLLEEALLKIINKRVYRIELDLSDVKHMDYRGVEIMVKRAERLRAFGGDLVLVNVSPYLSNIIQMAGAGDVFNIAIISHPQQQLFAREKT